MKFCYTRCYYVVGIFKAVIKFMGLLNLFDFMTFSNYFLTFFSTRIYSEFHKYYDGYDLIQKQELSENNKHCHLYEVKVFPEINQQIKCFMASLYFLDSI